MTRRWPYVLPRVMAPGYSHQPVSQMRRTEMESGAARQRLTSTVALRRVQAKWRMSDIEKAHFDLWFWDRQVSICGASDDVAAWSPLGMTRFPADQVGPDGIFCDRIAETADTSYHRIEIALPDAALNGALVWATVAVRAAGRTHVRWRLADRNGALATMEVDLSALSFTLSGALSGSVEDAGDGWVRIAGVFPTGVGTEVPSLALALKDPSDEFLYAGDTALGVHVAQVQARLAQGGELFLPAGADGRALGAGSGAAWFMTELPFGGGLRQAEARFVDTPSDTAGGGLIWDVSGEMDVRNA